MAIHACVTNRTNASPSIKSNMHRGNVCGVAPTPVKKKTQRHRRPESMKNHCATRKREQTVHSNLIGPPSVTHRSACQPSKACAPPHVETLRSLVCPLHPWTRANVDPHPTQQTCQLSTSASSQQAHPRLGRRPLPLTKNTLKVTRKNT